jgi:hypothetical protein
MQFSTSLSERSFNFKTESKLDANETQREQKKFEEKSGSSDHADHHKTPVCYIVSSSRVPFQKGCCYFYMTRAVSTIVFHNSSAGALGVLYLFMPGAK